jgi:hypothetical protein
MVISLQSIVIVVLLVVAGYFAAKWLFKKDTEVENRRRAAADLAGTLKAVGLVQIPEFLVDYSVGDYSGMAQKIGQTAKLFASGEAAVLSEFNQVFDRLLAAKLSSVDGRAIIAAKLKDAVKADDPASVQDAPALTVK